MNEGWRVSVQRDRVPARQPRVVCVWTRHGPHGAGDEKPKTVFRINLFIWIFKIVFIAGLCAEPFWDDVQVTVESGWWGGCPGPCSTGSPRDSGSFLLMPRLPLPPLDPAAGHGRCWQAVGALMGQNPVVRPGLPAARNCLQGTIW